MGRSRTGRLVIALALLLLAGVVLVGLIGEVVVRPEVEDQIADALVDELGLADPPEVEVRGFPLMLRALQERVDRIDVTVDGGVFEGMRVESVELRIEDVSFDTVELLRGSGTMRMAGGHGNATVTDVDVSAYLASIGLVATVEFAPGTVRVSGPVTVAGVTADASVTGELALVGDVLRFTPTAVQAAALGQAVEIPTVEDAVRRHFAFEVPVPELRGVRLAGVELGEGTASISATIAARVVAY